MTDPHGGPPRVGRPQVASARPVTATYRLQLSPELDFAAAAGLVDYLADLGVSHLYLSPLLTARRGSTHGYDVADPTSVSAALGGEAGLRALADAAHRRGLGLVVDIVPNHLGTGADTPLWEQLLAEGQHSFADRVFDVDWEPAQPTAAGKVLLPVLGDQYGVVLHAGELELVDTDGVPRVRYHEHSFPLSAQSREAVERSGGVDAFRGTPGQPATFQRLHALLEAQHYRLVDWRIGDAVVNYRRFFAISDLAGVRVEDEVVFDLVHGLVLQLVADGVVDGLRVDHPDGLRDPARYFARLAEETGGVWTVAEKILERDETLPDWPVAGTTGYDFANDVLGLFVDPAARGGLDALDADMGGDPHPYPAQAAAAKAEVLAADLAADTRRLARRLWALTQEHPEVRDVDERACLAAVTALLVALPVYRTYVDPQTGRPRPEDVAVVERALPAARGRVGRFGFLVDFLADAVLGRVEASPAQRELAARFQQLSGAAMAKGVEDTVFYRHRRLLAVNEVGGDPDGLGLDVAAFHARTAARARRHPAAMVTTATHDTKRGEDTRLRIAALSEMVEDWAAAVRRWHAATAPFVTATPRGPAPDPQTQLLCYQTLVGVWPAPSAAAGDLRERVVAYLRKASREAKQRTSWSDPDHDFEAGVAVFVDALLGDDRASAVRAEIAEVAGRAAAVAVVSGLAQTLLRATVPGVPDTYQGTELWDTSLVDPDNRRPVDVTARAAALAALDAEDPDVAALLAAPGDGRVKLWVLSRALRTRRAHAGCFAAGAGYLPLAVTGARADHVVAFARTGPDDAAVVVTPRLPGALMRDGLPPLGEVWDDTAVVVPDHLRGRAWRDALGGPGHADAAALPLADLLGVLPVALLTRG